ncbi:MAG: exodeoxyribonuclease V subunit beta [Betaproteobacteria bacterium]
MSAVTRQFTALDVFTCPLAGIRQIEASAGTGKTWNICGLYLRLLLERGLDVQRILVVTFTNAATAELRERIRQRVVDTLAFLQPGHGIVTSGDDFVERLVASVRDLHGVSAADMVVRLELALATFDEASIFTIHGFCQRALADTPFTAQMPLALELVRDDADWVAEAANDFWRRTVAADDLDAALAAHLVASKDTPERFAGLLKRHLSKPLARGVWPDGIERAGRVDAEALDVAHAVARDLWDARRDEIEALMMDSLAALNGVSYKEDTVRAAMASWDELLRAADGMAALAVDVPRLDLLGAARLAKGTKKKETTPSHEFFDLAQRVLDLRAEAMQSLALQRLSLLRSMLEQGSSAQRDAKRRQRVIAFDDMLFNLYDRLTSGDSPWLAAALKARFPAALIDEFQDTDPLQFAIFKTIYAGHDEAAEAAPLFFVGDPKQAIYSFRNADLQTYLAAGEHAIAHYSLADNQRSTEPLIRALNLLFMANPAAFMQAGLGYQEIAFGKKPRKTLVDTSGPGASLQVWTLPDADDGEPMFQRDAKAAVVAATASEIARLLAAARRGEIRLDGEPLAAGDIAVLVRSNAEGGLVRQALTAVGVGSVELSQASVFASSDAEELDRVLSAMLEPARERKLKAALATEAMGRDAAAIAALGSDEPELLAAVQRFAGWRDTWLQRGVGFMLRQWLASEHVAGRLLVRPDGERRLTNLLHLIECLHEAGEKHATPDTLLRWFQSQRVAPEANDATQLRLESDQNLVQIVTIHKSKGLEYPIVFCPFLWGTARGGRPDGLDGVAYHDDDGHTVIDYGHAHLPTERQEEIKQRLRLEESAESLRLIYVALTRAVHRCVIVAGCFRAQVGRSAHATGSTRSLLNWLVAGAGMTPADWFEHKQGVTPIRAAWQALAERSNGAIGVAPLPLVAATALRLERASPDTLAALPPPRTLPGGWWIGSFSAIAHGAAHDRSGADHDLRAVDVAAPEQAPPRIADDDALNFPRGPAAGECIHQAFESIDFTDASAWPAAVANAVRLLRTMGVADPRGPGPVPLPAEVDALRERMLARMLADVLATLLPLGTAQPLRLATLPAARKLVELEFHLPSHRLAADALNDALAEAGYAMPALSFTALRGFLKGFVDLVFEHDGRFFILDWKSNHLGDTPADYGQPKMAAAMRDQGYHLQYLLYLVALDRYLRHRLADYDAERHLGGAVYLFVRGVRPDWHDAAGAPAGVFFDRPPVATIRCLSALFDGVEVAA